MATTARISAVKAAAGAVTSGSTLAFSSCQIAQGCMVLGAGSYILVPDGSYHTMYFGYPTGLTISGGYSGIRDWVQLDGFTTIEYDCYTAYFLKDGAPDPTNCKVKFVSAFPSTLAPAITTVTSGC